MCIKIQYDEDFRKFCKIFWQLNMTLVGSVTLTQLGVVDWRSIGSDGRVT
jgi:hypothetical protein